MPISSKELTAKHMKQKPAHSLGQNTAYMISLVWRRRRSVIWLSLTMSYPDLEDQNVHCRTQSIHDCYGCSHFHC